MVGPKPRTDAAVILEKQAAQAKSLADQAALASKLATEMDIVENTFGASAKTIEQYTAIMNGAKAANVEMIGQLHDLKDAQAIVAANKTPMHKAREELEQVDQLSGILGPEQYRKALLRLKKQVTPAALSGDREAKVALLGSQEWAKAFSRSSAGVAEMDEQQLDELRKGNDFQSDIRERLGKIVDRQPVPLQVPPGG